MKTTKLPEKSYLGSKELDSLARMQTELLSELWILRDRVTILEQLLTDADILVPDQIDNHVPTETLEERLKLDRDQMVARVVGAGHRTELSIDSIKTSVKNSAD